MNPRCRYCDKPLTAQRDTSALYERGGPSYGSAEWRAAVRSAPITGYGYESNGAFCTLRCGYRWALRQLGRQP